MKGTGVLGVALALALASGGRAVAQAPAPITHGPGDRQAVALACNVVWGTEYVAPLLAALQEHHARATFFLGGLWTRAHPELARQLAAAGMELGNHGYAHRHVARLSLEDNLAEIARAHREILQATGTAPRLYAPAYGEVSPAVLQAAHRLGYRTVLWSIDTVDWRPSHTEAVIRRRVLSRLAPGAIVLIHPTDRTARALPGLLAELARRGYAVTTVSRLLGGSGKSPALRPPGTAGNPSP